MIVVTTGDRNLANLIQPNGEARGRHGLGSVYDDLRIIEATWRAIEKREVMEIPAMNRMIIEETTHPDALDAIVNELGGRWKAHARTVMGHDLAAAGLAGIWRLDRSKPFGDFAFPSKELSLAIRTRLGEDDRIADFAPALPGPLRTSPRAAHDPGISGAWCALRFRAVRSLFFSRADSVRLCQPEIYL